MALQLDAVKAAVRAMLTMPIPPDVAIGVDGHDTVSLAALVGINALLVADPEPPSGWLRAALLLTDTRRRYALDAVGTTLGDACMLRCGALLDLPDLTAVGSLPDVYGIINAAIAVGAPRYNSGDVRGCCTAYWAAAQAIVSAPVFRGFPGHARALGPLRTVLETEITPAPLTENGVDQFAWSLRHALDNALATS